MIVFAVDPGNEESAYVLYDSDDGSVIAHAKKPNPAILGEILTLRFDAIVVEMVESFGMPVGREVFETVWWSGRFHERASTKTMPDRLRRLPRKAVKMHLCGSMRAKDGNIRQALIDRYGGKEKAIGKKDKPGPLYGLSGDCWSALAVAVTWADQNAAKSA